MATATFPIKARYLLLVWVVLIIYTPGFDAFESWLGDELTWYWRDVSFYWYYQLVIGSVLLVLLLRSKLSLRQLYSQPSPQSFLPAVNLTAFTFLFSVASIYALFYPLSLIYPEFVDWWLIDQSTLLYRQGDEFPILANVMNVISLCVIAPLLEETTFRCVFLHRWAERWGLLPAMMLSSFLFALIHSDPMGAFAFAVAMCVIYIKSKSLWLPVTCHGVYNAAVWLVALGYDLYIKPEGVYTLADFQAEWPIGLGLSLVCLLWLAIYFHIRQPTQHWHLPNYSLPQRISN